MSIRKSDRSVHKRLDCIRKSDRISSHQAQNSLTFAVDRDVSVTEHWFVA